MSRRTLPKDSPVFVHAHELLAQQEAWHQQLLKRQSPSSTADDFFTALVVHVRRLLSRSPRTILRQAMTLASRNIVPSQLLTLLQLDESVHDLPCIAQAVHNVSPGKTFRRVQQLRQRLRDQDQPQQYNSNNSLDLIYKIKQGIERKHGKAVEMVELQQKLRTKEKENLIRLQKELKRHEKTLINDEEYRRHQQVQNIWHNCGAAQLWENVERLDRAISTRRNARGLDFEQHYSDLVFAMIATQLARRSEEPSKPWEFSYETNLHWLRNGTVVGEIDIVVYDKDKQVVAICEMKTSCYELSVGLQQHDAKLSEAAACAISGIRWAIGKTASESVDVTGRCIALYLTTLVPSKEEGTEYTGAEPALVHAICQGIRKQGKQIVHESNLDICQALVGMLEDANFHPKEALDYLTRLPPQSDIPHVGHDLNYDNLQKDVEDLMQWTHWKYKSPLNFLKTFPPGQVLILPDS